ncbi:calmodulin-binding family protein [Salix suchowensis]|nr:calmodulin-binding family protein [Salix suchowensis]
MSRFRRIEIFEPHYAPALLRETSIFTPKAFGFPSFEEPEELAFAAFDLLYSKPTTFEVFDTVTDLVNTRSSYTKKSVHDRFATDLRLQTLSHRVSELESKFDRLVNAKINVGSGAERKYTWTAEIKGPVTERKYKLTAEIKGGEEEKKKKKEEKVKDNKWKEEKVKNYKWTAEIKGKEEEEIPISRKYTFETSSGFAGSKSEKKEKEKKKEAKEKKGECATRLVEIEDYPDHGAAVLRQAFAKRAGVVEKRKGKRKELSPQDAALLIQITFRAYLIRRSQALRALRELAIAKAKLKELRALFNNFSYRRHVARDAEERQRFTEKIIVLLLTVDAIEGADLMVRSAKRSMVDELEAMLDAVDPQPAGNSLSMRRRTFDMPDGVIRREIAEGVAQVVQMLDNEDNGSNTFEACL